MRPLNDVPVPESAYSVAHCLPRSVANVPTIFPTFNGLDSSTDAFFQSVGCRVDSSGMTPPAVKN